MTDNIPFTPPGIIMEKNNIQIRSGEVADLSADAIATTVEKLTKGTIIISYTSTSNAAYQSLLSIGNKTLGNQDRHFHIYIYIYIYN